MKTDKKESFGEALARGAVITLKRKDGSIYLTFDASTVTVLGKTNPAWLKNYNRACREGRRLGFREFDVYATRVANRIAIKRDSYVVCRNDVIGAFQLKEGAK
jgi:hypothetical protein